MSRAAERAGFTLPVRVRLVEGDVDTLEEGQQAMVRAIDNLRESTSAEINGLKRVMVGILISVTTASILLAVNAMLLRG